MSFFNNKFPARNGYEGKTLSWNGSDTYHNFLRYGSNPYTEESITYKMNEYGFRSDPFEPSNYRLAFIGCSITEGIGLPLEETFSYQVYSNIKKAIGKEFPYWNLGLGGCGLDSIIRSYYNFHDIIKPQVVIALFTGYRLELFKDIWYSILPNSDIHRILSKNPYLIDKNVIRYNTEKNLAMLDLMLEKNKTMLIWDRWDASIFENVDLSHLNNFNNYIGSWTNVVAKNKSLPRARDGSHIGKQAHIDFADSILAKYGDKICEKLVFNREV